MEQETALASNFDAVFPLATSPWEQRQRILEQRHNRRGGTYFLSTQRPTTRVSAYYRFRMKGART
jgi:hypothetical protein